MFKKNRITHKPVFMIIPMIDIIFFLLVFFMMNSLETVAQKVLSVQLPQAKTVTAPAQMAVLVTVDKDGHIMVDSKPLSFDDATQLIKQHTTNNPEVAVILQADKQTSHGQVIALMDMLKANGVKRFSIAAEAKR